MENSGIKCSAPQQNSTAECVVTEDNVSEISN